MNLEKIEQLVDEFNEKLMAELDSSNLGTILDEIHYQFHCDIIEAINTAKAIAAKYEAWKNPPRKVKKQKSKEVF